VRTSVLLSALILAGCGAASSGPVDPLDADPLPLGDFALIERSGKSVCKADLRGKVWIASFIFTRCNGPCPSVTATMARLQHELADQPDVRLVTITVDPERDQLKDLNDYAERYRADPQRWLFLTGKQDDVHRLVREGFHVPVAPAKDAAGQPTIEHSTRLVLVDRQGRIRGYFQGMQDTEAADGDRTFDDDLKRLRGKVAALVREKP
jgi:cytochrome oxidase Cu insertion factor (SCO1/SenC/PrrC family)